MVEAAADRADVVVGRDVDAGRARPLLEQGDGVRFAQRQDRVLALAREMERLAARDQQLELRARGEELAELGGSGQQVLEVVEQEQEPLRGDVIGEAVGHPEGLGDRGRDECGIAEGSEPDPEDAVREEIRDVRGGLRGERVLPDPACRQRQQRVQSSASSAVTSWSSRSRPRKGVAGTGRLVW